MLLQIQDQVVKLQITFYLTFPKYRTIQRPRIEYKPPLKNLFENKGQKEKT